VEGEPDLPGRAYVGLQVTEPVWLVGGVSEQGGATILGEGHTVVGEGVFPSLDPLNSAPAEPGNPVVLAEGPAPMVSGGRQEALAVWLFAADHAPYLVPLERAPDLIQDDANFVWVDLSGYDEDTLRRVAALLQLPRHAVHAALSPWQRPRLTVYPDRFFVSVTVPRLDPVRYRVQAGEFDLLVGRNLLVSAHKQALPFGAHLSERARQSPDLVRLDAAFMLYLVLDELLAYDEELDRHLHIEIERLEERALRQPSDSFLEEVLRFKRYAFALYQLVDQHRALFSAFLRPDFRWVAGEEVEDYFEDLEGRLERLLGSLQVAHDASTGAFDLYVSHLSHRTNQIIKVLTVVSTILLPASVLIALSGTTLQGIGTYGATGFVSMLLCVALVCGAVLLIFRRRGWI
jgi:magnesium transporter